MLTALLITGGIGFIIGVIVMGCINYASLRKWRKSHESKRGG